jgi:hypothetical protein
MSSKLRTASWSLLTFEAAVLLLFSCASAYLAYSGQSYSIADVAVEKIAADNAAVETGLRASRGTAAAFSAGFAMFMLLTIVGPYRAGHASSWWILLAGLLAMAAVTLLRIPTIGTRAGTAVAMILAGFGVFALLLDVGRLRKRG